MRKTAGTRSAVHAIPVAIALLGGAGNGGAQEIAPFRMTGYEGYVSARYLSDSTTTVPPGGTGLRTRQRLADLREEVFVMTHNYVYHPNLLSLDIGGGPILQRGSFSNDNSDTSSQNTLYNFVLRAGFLRQQPYRGSLFFEHLNPNVSVAPGQVLVQENTRYGMEMSLLDPVTPMPLFLDATHAHVTSSGADRIFDDTTDRFNFRTLRNFGSTGSASLRYSAGKHESQSGSPNLPIQGSTSNDQSVNLDTRLRFGEDKQYSLTNLVTLDTQSYTLGQGSTPDRRSLRILLDLRGQHSEDLQSSVQVNHVSVDQGIVSSQSDSVSGGVNYRFTRNLTTSFGAHSDETRTEQVTYRNTGGNGSVSYRRELPLGVALVNYGLRQESREQSASSAQSGVIGESVTLAGTTPTTLSRQNVVAASIVVSNAGRTQTFVEGIDYTVTVVGANTRLQRLITGNIFDGQNLLVDYSFATGGTFSYTQTDQNFGINWQLSRLFNTYYRQFDSTPRITAGSSTIPLVATHSQVVGLRTDFPVLRRPEVSAGGGVERERRRDTLAPLRRESEDVYVQTEEFLFGTGFIRLSLYRNRVLYDSSSQNANVSFANTDTTGHNLSYTARLPYGINLTASNSASRNTGGLQATEYSTNALNLQWGYRKATVTMNIGQTKETQADNERTRTLGQVLFRREL